MNRVDFEFDGQKYYVRQPNRKDLEEAQKVYISSFKDAIRNGAIIRAKLDDYLTEQGLWDKDRQDKKDMLIQTIHDGELRLKRGGIKASEAREIAIEMRHSRAKLLELIGERTSLESLTAEGVADNAKFNYLTFACSYHADNRKFFNNYNEFLNSDVTTVSLLFGVKLANLIYNLDENYDANLPENKFLLKYNFVDEKLRLINKNGRLIDEDGRLIDEFGRFVNEEGHLIDINGNLLNDEGGFSVEFGGFFDDDGVLIEQKDNAVVQDNIIVADAATSVEVDNVNIHEFSEVPST